MTWLHSESVTSLIADPGVISLILAKSHTIVEIDHEIISTVILLLLMTQEGLLSDTKQKNVHKVLVNSLVKLAHEKGG